MIIEHATLPVVSGREADFERSMRQALPIIESADGCHGAEVRRQIEDATVFLLIVKWSSVEAHMAFRASPLFTQWRELTHPFYSQAPVVTHFQAPLER